MSQQSVRQAARRSQLAEFRVLLDLTAERVWDLRRDPCPEEGQGL
jgi:hypothetical protein